MNKLHKMMNNQCYPSLEGDGINFSFFHHLWIKNRNQDKEHGNKGYHNMQDKTCKNISKIVQLRLPDTVVFRLGQPLQWYFTCEHGGQPSILRKRKQNLNIEKIEEIFIQKGRAVNKGWLDPNNDILAYFISCSSDESNEQHHNITTSDCLAADTDKDQFFKNEESMTDDYCKKNSCCNIEYFNAEGLSKLQDTNSSHQFNS
jgi:hypothetical protein